MAEGGGLLNRYRVVKPYRGFESLRLRHPCDFCFFFEFLFDAFPGLGFPGLGASRYPPRRRVRGRPYPEKLADKDELRDRGGGFDEASRAIAGRELELALCFLFVFLQQRQFSAVEIGFAGLRQLCPGIVVDGSADGLFGAEFAKELADNRRRPHGHVQLLRGLRQMARDIIVIGAALREIGRASCRERVSCCV